MVDLRSYVQQAMQAGYGQEAVRAQLYQLGYSHGDIEASFRKRMNWRWFILGIVAIGAIVWSLAFLHGPEIFAITLSAPSNVKQGSQLSWSILVTGTGNPLVNYELRGRAGVVLQSSEQISVKGSGKFTGSFRIPEKLSTGPYVLVAKIMDTSSSANMFVRPAETCNDGIKNQDEKGVDCGGICKPCGQLSLACGHDCDDSDACSKDECRDGECISTPIVPCCGNGVCESEESPGVCAQDCKPVQIIRTSDDVLKDAKSLAESQPDRAAYLCTGMALVSDTDSCLKAVATAAKKSSLCGQISGEQEHDSCLLYFAVELHDFSSCNDLRNKYVQSSCYSMQQLSTPAYSKSQ